MIDAHAYGQSAFSASDERAFATAIGLVIVALAFFVFRDRPTGSGDGAQVAAVRRP